MPKSMSFSLRNRKNRPALGAETAGFAADHPLCFQRLGATPPGHRISPISLRIPRCALNYKRRFHVT